MKENKKKGPVAVQDVEFGGERDERLREAGKAIIGFAFRDETDGLDRIRAIDEELSRRANLQVVGDKE